MERKKKRILIIYVMMWWLKWTCVCWGMDIWENNGWKKKCGGPWIVGGAMRHEHHRDQSCWLTGQIYTVKGNTEGKKKVKVSDGKLCPTPPRHTTHTVTLFVLAFLWRKESGWCSHFFLPRRIFVSMVEVDMSSHFVCSFLFNKHKPP